MATFKSLQTSGAEATSIKSGDKQFSSLETQPLNKAPKVDPTAGISAGPMSVAPNQSLIPTGSNPTALPVDTSTGTGSSIQTGRVFPESTAAPQQDPRLAQIAIGLEAAKQEALSIQEQLAKLKAAGSTDTSFAGSSDAQQQIEGTVTDTVAKLTPPSDGVKGAISASEQYDAKLASQETELEQRREREVKRIEEQFAQAKEGLQDAQGRETGTFATTLQRIGGFLGPSASATGAMLSLAKSHRGEVTALEGKKAQAIQEANNAISDKQFELALMRVQEVKDLEQTINDRKQQFFDNSLKITQEERRQDEFAREKFKDDLDTLGTLATSDANLQLDPARAQEIDEFYGVPGFTQAYIDVVRGGAESDSEKAALENKTKMLDFLQSIPQGQEVSFPDGSTYTGMGSAGDIATYKEVDDEGNVYMISHNKLTGQSSVNSLGQFGATGSSGTDGVNSTQFDNIVGGMSQKLEEFKNEDGTYDPDVYLEMRAELKKTHPNSLKNVDNIFLNPTDSFFSVNAVDRLRSSGVTLTAKTY